MADGAKPGVTKTVAIGVLGLAVLAVGYVGFLAYSPPAPGDVRGYVDLFYSDLQLFGLNFDVRDGVPVPVCLQIARVAAPMVLVLGAAVAAFGKAWWWRRRFTLVVGDTAEARAVAQAKRQVRPRRAVFQIPRGDSESLRAAGVRRARAVYVCGQDRLGTTSNIAIANTAATLTDGSIYVHVLDPDLAIGQRAVGLMASEEPRQAITDYFNIDEIAAGVLLAGDQRAGDYADIVVAGSGAFARAVVVASARRRRQRGGSGARLKVTLVDENAHQAAQQLIDRWRIVEELCEVNAVAADMTSVLRKSTAARLYVCYDDERRALSAALAAVHVWRGAPESIVVRLCELAPASASGAGAAGKRAPMGAAAWSRVTVANVAELAAPVVVASRKEPFEDIYWELAQRVHEGYLRSVGADKRPPTKATERPWAQLDDDTKASNYDQARHLGERLQELGATVVPRSKDNPEFVISPDEVDRLAPKEHARWMKHRHDHGWRPGGKRTDEGELVTDEERKLHPAMVDWEVLPEIQREKDRNVVRSLAADYGDVLADFGLQIVRF